MPKRETGRSHRLPPWGSVTSEGDELVLRTTVLGGMTLRTALMMSLGMDLKGQSPEELAHFEWTSTIVKQLTGNLNQVMSDQPENWIQTIAIPPRPQEVELVDRQLVMKCPMAYALFMQGTLQFTADILAEVVRNRNFLRGWKEEGFLQDFRSVNQHVVELLAHLEEPLRDRDFGEAIDVLVELRCPYGHQWNEKFSFDEFDEKAQWGKCPEPSCQGQAKVESWSLVA